MSREFVEFTFPCKECIVTAMCQDYTRLKKKDQLDVRSMCLAVPKFGEKEGPYHKLLLECMANISKRITSAVDKAEDPIGTNTVNNIPHRYVLMMCHMTEIMVYMTNSTSWETGKLENFDEFEINRKLKLVRIL